MDSNGYLKSMSEYYINGDIISYYPMNPGDRMVISEDKQQEYNDYIESLLDEYLGSDAA